MPTRMIAVIATLALIACESFVAGEDWPHIRGARFDGVSRETKLLGRWPEGGPRRVWSRALGQGHSGIVVAGGRLFTQYQSAAGQFLLCLDPKTGAALWETRYARAWQLHGAYPGPYSSPTVDDGKVYFASPTGLVGCVRAESGERLWSIEIDERFGGRGYSFGFAATPLVEAGRVYLPVGGRNASMVALDAASGATIWAAGSDPASYCPALPITVGKRRCIVGYMENALVLFDAANGAVLHRQRLSSGYDEHSAWPVFREPDLLLTAPFRTPARCLTLREKDDVLEVKEKWVSKHLSNDVASSVLVGDAIFGFDLKQLQSSAHRPSRGTFRCVDWRTGATLWSTERVGHATVLAADDKLFLGADGGELILASANANDYVELSRVGLFDDEICWTPPTLWRGKLFVRSPSQLICLDVSGSEAAPTPTISQAPRRWRVDPSWLLSREREYPNDAPTWRENREWFAACLLMIGMAALIAVGLGGGVRRLLGGHASVYAIFLALMFLLGLLGPGVLSAAAERCLWTWPLSVFAILHGAARACLRSRPWVGRGWILALALACAGYFVGCRWVGMPVGWYYLLGLPLGLPFSLLAAHLDKRPWLAGPVTLLAFAAFFATGPIWLAWKGS